MSGSTIHLLHKAQNKCTMSKRDTARGTLASLPPRKRGARLFWDKASGPLGSVARGVSLAFALPLLLALAPAEVRALGDERDAGGGLVEAASEAASSEDDEGPPAEKEPSAEETAPVDDPPPEEAPVDDPSPEDGESFLLIAPPILDEPESEPRPLSSPPVDESEIDDAWRQYHEALLQLIEGDSTVAERVLERLSISHPDHPAGHLAAQALLLMEAQAPGPGRPAALPPPDHRLKDERPSEGARLKLAGFQAIHGLFVGYQLCGFLGLYDPLTEAYITMGTGLAGLGVSLVATRQGVRTGQVQAINSGTLWGAWHGAALRTILQPPTHSARMAVHLGAQLTGMGAGVLLGTMLEPMAGDVSLATAAGIWTGVLSTFLLGVFQPNLSDRTLLLMSLIASDLGLAAGALAVQHVQMTPGRVHRISLWGGLGGLGGGLVGFGSGNDRLGFGFTVLGALGGLWYGYHSTERRGDDAPSYSLGLMPVEGGAALTFGRSIGTAAR